MRSDGKLPQELPVDASGLVLQEHCLKEACDCSAVCSVTLTHGSSGRAPHAQILGEKLMLGANGRGGLSTVALRPSGIFGEGDPLLVPLTVANAKRGKMKYIVGGGANLMDFTYVGNVAQAHLLVRACAGELGSRIKMGILAQQLHGRAEHPWHEECNLRHTALGSKHCSCMLGTRLPGSLLGRCSAGRCR